MEWKSELNLWTKTILTRGSELLMALNKLVTDFSNKEDDDNEQETSEMQFEEFAFASRSKAEAKPRRRTFACSSTRTVPICERSWTDFEPGAHFDQAYPVAKRINTLSSSWSSTSRRRWSDRILVTER